MTPPTTDTNPDGRDRDSAAGRPLFALAIVAGCTALFGLAIADRAGGFGPALLHVGATIGVLAMVLGFLCGLLPPGAVRVLRRAALASVPVTLLALVMLEVVSRRNHPLPEFHFEPTDSLDRLQRPHTDLGWVPAPDYALDVRFAQGTVHVRTNSRGLRDIEQERNPSLPCVVIIGDSYGLGWGGEYDESVTPRLRKALPGVQVFNASWTGYALDQVARSYAVRAKPLRPDVVLVMVMFDPCVDESEPLYLGLRKPWYELRDGALLACGIPIEFPNRGETNRKVFREWEASRVTGPVSAFRFLFVEAPRRYLAFGRRIFPRHDWERIRREGFPRLGALSAAILSDLHARVREDGARLVLAIAPPPAVFQNCEDPVAAMRPFLTSFEAIGITPLDITPSIADDPAAHYNRVAHPNAAGLDRVLPDLTDRVRTALRELGKIR